MPSFIAVERRGTGSHAACLTEAADDHLHRITRLARAPQTFGVHGSGGPTSVIRQRPVVLVRDAARRSAMPEVSDRQMAEAVFRSSAMPGPRSNTGGHRGASAV